MRAWLVSKLGPIDNIGLMAMGAVVFMAITSIAVLICVLMGLYYSGDLGLPGFVERWLNRKGGRI